MPSGSKVRAAAAALGAMVAASAGQSLARDQAAWVTKGPSLAELQAARPAGASGGRSIAQCDVSASAVLSGCHVVDEWPSGQGLGAALMTLVPKFAVKPATHNGRPVASTVLIAGDFFGVEKKSSFLRRPSPQDILSVWPTEALRRGIDGAVQLDCIVTVQGALTNCVALEETPTGLSYGAAARALTPQFLMRPAEKDGRAVVSSIILPIRFEANGGNPAVRSDDGYTADPAMVWAEAPTYQDVAAAYPQKAKAAKLGGRATLFCNIGKDGRLRLCRSIEEAPRGLGFADAARELAKRFQSFTKTSDGKPLQRASLQLPITFDPALLNGGAQAIGRPQWASLPSADETRTAFAGMPEAVGSVRVVVDCRVQPRGWLSDCSVTSEDPRGFGFGKAALALAAKFRVTTWSEEGLPVIGGLVHVPIRFETGDPTAAAKAP